jgi:hypothetical protein
MTPSFPQLAVPEEGYVDSSGNLTASSDPGSLFTAVHAPICGIWLSLCWRPLSLLLLLHQIGQFNTAQ